MDVTQQIEALQRQVERLTGIVEAQADAATVLSITEKARIIREAHASGNRAQIRRAHRQINGGR